MSGTRIVSLRNPKEQARKDLVGRLRALADRLESSPLDECSEALMVLGIDSKSGYLFNEFYDPGNAINLLTWRGAIYTTLDATFQEPEPIPEAPQDT